MPDIPQRPPLFSVVVPTLNRPKRIEACLRSLALQTHSSYEIIVIDDGSTDSTPERISAVASEFLEVTIVSLRNAHQSGANHSRNRGIAAARGEYVAFLDDDCVADPDWLRHLETAFTDASVAATSGLVEDQEPENIYELVFRGTHRLASPGPARRSGGPEGQIPAHSQDGHLQLEQAAPVLLARYKDGVLPLRS